MFDSMKESGRSHDSSESRSGRPYGERASMYSSLLNKRKVVGISQVLGAVISSYFLPISSSLLDPSSSQKLVETLTNLLSLSTTWVYRGATRWLQSEAHNCFGHLVW